MHFSIGVLPPDRQAGELEARLVPVYLLHRYQTEAVARLRRRRRLCVFRSRRS